MQRDLAALTRSSFDLLVIGGGSHGLFAAYDAALRGLTVAVVDRGDFGGGLSAAHQRTLHGGLRALQSRDLAKTRAQIEERRAWARIAPHLIRPLPFLIGTYGRGMRSRLVIGAGFRVYDWLSRHRNDGVTPELHLPKTRLETPVMTTRLFPGIRPDGLTGGALWYDYQTTHAERLTWAVARAAAEAGATLANYVHAVGQPAPGRVQLRDTRTDETFEVAARAVILTAAEGMAALYRAFGLGEAPPLIRAMNLLIECARPNTDVALVAPSSSGRMLTAVPWRGHVLVGTSQSATAETPGTRAADADVEAFLAEANSAFPFLRAGRDQVRLVHDGLVPATRGRRGLDLPRDFAVRDHADAGQPHVVSIVGAKYTTARRAAAAAVDHVCRALGRPKSRSGTAERVLPHAGIADVEGQLIEAGRAANVTLPADVQRHLASWYGTEASALLGYALASPVGLDRLEDGQPFLTAEIPYARDTAMAVTVDDALYRRTAIGGTGRIPQAVLDKARTVFGEG